VKHQQETERADVVAKAQHALAEQSPITMQQLAHELNTLLDGAMRCVRSAQRLLDETSRTPVSESTLTAGHAEPIVQKLQLATSSMQQMAALLEAAMNADGSYQPSLSSDRPLGEFVPDLLTSLQPKASDHQVMLNLHMTNDAAAVPTGPLGTVLLNGLTNAIEACLSSMNVPRVVEVSLSINTRSELVILISDTGHGIIEGRHIHNATERSTKPGGHGIGLTHCRQIIDDLGGRMKLSNIPFGAGAIFQVHIPLRRLRAA
jgi:signal transduction histidine kinase